MNRQEKLQYYDMLKNLDKYTNKYSKASFNMKPVFLNNNVDSFLKNFKKKVIHGKSQEAVEKELHINRKKNVMKEINKSFIDKHVVKFPVIVKKESKEKKVVVKDQETEIENTLLNMPSNIIPNTNIINKNNLFKIELSSIFDLDYNKKPTKKLIGIKKLSEEARKYMRSRERTPEVGKYSPNYNAILKKSQSYLIYPKTSRITSKQQSSINSSICSQKSDDVSKVSYKNEAKCSLQPSLNSSVIRSVKSSFFDSNNSYCYIRKKPDIKQIIISNSIKNKLPKLNDKINSKSMTNLYK